MYIKCDKNHANHTNTNVTSIAANKVRMTELIELRFYVPPDAK